MAPSPFIIVAIDGGAASGKSSSSRTLSERFNLLHADTGSYYRAVTAELLRRGVTPTDLPGVNAALAAVTFTTRVTGRSAEIELSGHTIPDAEIRSPEVTANVALFAAIPEVRAALLDYQRSQAETARKNNFRGLVMEGRDIGSKISRRGFSFFSFCGRNRGGPPTRPTGSARPGFARNTLDGQRLKESLQGAVVIDRHASHARPSRRNAFRSDRRPAGRHMSRAFPQVEMQRVYGFCHYLIRVAFDAVFRGEVAGTENIPADGPF